MFSYFFYCIETENAVRSCVLPESVAQALQFIKGGVAFQDAGAFGRGNRVGGLCLEIVETGKTVVIAIGHDGVVLGMKVAIVSRWDLACSARRMEIRCVGSRTGANISATVTHVVLPLMLIEVKV